jgi:hypothetical protein
MHPKVLGTEVGLRQRVAAACNSRAGRRAESLDSNAVTPEQLVQIPCCAECGLVWWPDEQDRFAPTSQMTSRPSWRSLAKCAEREFRD